MPSQGGEGLLHEAPLPFEILGNVILARGKHLLDGDVDPQVRACGVCERDKSV